MSIVYKKKALTLEYINLIFMHRMRTVDFLSSITCIEFALGKNLLLTSMNRGNNYSKRRSMCI